MTCASRTERKESSACSCAAAEDVFSFGALAFFILTGYAALKQPLSSNTRVADAALVELTTLVQNELFPVFYDVNLVFLLRRCLVEERLARPTMCQVVLLCGSLAHTVHHCLWGVVQVLSWLQRPTHGSMTQGAREQDVPIFPRSGDYPVAVSEDSESTADDATLLPTTAVAPTMCGLATLTTTEATRGEASASDQLLQTLRVHCSWAEVRFTSCVYDLV